MTEHHRLTPPPFLLFDNKDGTLTVYRPAADGGDSEEGITLTEQECCAIFWYLRDTRLMPSHSHRPWSTTFKDPEIG